jgi:Ala-tRNA(Pro) deacylase
MHIPAYLAANRVAFETLFHPPANTAQKRAHYLHLPGARVTKSVLLRGPSEYILAVLPATMQVNTGRLAEIFGNSFRLATNDEIPEVFTDCEWGVVPPFGRLYGVKTVLEDSLGPDDDLIFDSNHQAEGIRMICRDYEELEKPGRARFGQKPSRVQ